MALAPAPDYTGGDAFRTADIGLQPVSVAAGGLHQPAVSPTVRELGGIGLATTDLVNARSLLEKKARALKLIETSPADRPLAVQLFGSVPEEMRDAAVYLESLGVASADINMGCPVRKVCRVGGGSAMMTELDKTARLVKGMVEAVKIPITAKMRLGWDEKNLTAPDLARALEDAGVAAVFVHGRTREQGFPGPSTWPASAPWCRRSRRCLSSATAMSPRPQAAKVMLEQTGCAGVSIGRGAFYNPWIFHHTRHYLKTGELLPEPSFEERVRVMCRHLDLMIEVFGEAHGCRMFRKIAPWHARRFGPVNEFNKRVVLVSTRADFLDVLARYRRWREPFLDPDGELKPRFRPPPMTASFMQAPGAAPHAHIAVPKGPVEVW